jgi:hypothetical protein
MSPKVLKVLSMLAELLGHRFTNVKMNVSVRIYLFDLMVRLNSAVARRLLLLVIFGTDWMRNGRRLFRMMKVILIVDVIEE